MVEVRLTAVRVDLQSNTPVLLLQETASTGRVLPIFVGTPEATAIALAQQGVELPRPMTHDLLKQVIEALGGRVEQVMVTDLQEGTFFAEIHLQADSGPVVLSSRPSDAVALSVRVGCPLFVADDLMEAEGVVLAVDEEPTGDEDMGNPDEIVGQFREFLEHVRPEDFSAGGGSS